MTEPYKASKIFINKKVGEKQFPLTQICKFDVFYINCVYLYMHF